MEGTYAAKLEINNMSIPLEHFPEQVVARSIAGAVSTLKGTDKIDDIELTMLHGEVTLLVNSTEVELTRFPNHILASLVAGVVSPLKGAEDTDNVSVTISIT